VKDPTGTEFRLHPGVKLAEGVVLTPEAWALHGALLCGGIARHVVTVTGFPRGENGVLGIRLNIRPLGVPEPLRFRES